jgi:hypothetical protein
MPIDTEVVKITLTRAQSAGTRIWSIDSPKLEAILGLWVWSIKAQATAKDNEDGDSSSARDVPNARFVFVDGSKFAALHADHALSWIDRRAVELVVEGAMRLKNSTALQLSRLWHPQALTRDIAADDPMSRGSIQSS